MSNQEILPPQRGPHGHYAPGTSGNPRGRPPGAEGGHTRAIRDMVKSALDMVGGDQYLAMQAFLNPAAFIGLIGKTMPLKLTSDEDGATAFVVARRIVTHAPLPGEND